MSIWKLRSFKKALNYLIVLSMMLSLSLSFAATATDGGVQQQDTVNSSEAHSFMLLDLAALNELKAKYKNGDEDLTARVEKLKESAEQALKGGPYSVTYKKATPPSGDKHDYMTIGIYWWPNPDTKDKLPYIRKDGKVNPEVNNDTFDKLSYGKMSSAVQTLALAYFYTDNEDYANYAAKLLRVWYLDPSTRMNPNLNFGQAVPGLNNGRAEGIIETVNLINIIDSSILLNATSKAFSGDDMVKFKAWVAEYLKWLQESDIGTDERNAKNNHGEWYDAQVVSYAMFTGQYDLAKSIINDYTKSRIDSQIDADGKLPREMSRTRSLHYPIYAMRAFLTVAILGEKLDMDTDLWNYTTDDGRGLRLALDYLTPYIDGSNEWELSQVITENESSFSPFLRRAAAKYNYYRYLVAADKLLETDSLSRINLMYPIPQLEK